MILAEKPAELIAPVLRRERLEDEVALEQMYLEFDPKGASLGLPPRGDPAPWVHSLSDSPNFILEVDGRIVGHSVLCPEGTSGEVAVFVHQDFRGRGMGKMLLTEVIAEARRLGLKRIWGITEPDNLPMLRLAHSVGFRSGADLSEFHLNLT